MQQDEHNGVVRSKIRNPAFFYRITKSIEQLCLCRINPPSAATGTNLTFDDANRVERAMKMAKTRAINAGKNLQL